MGLRMLPPTPTAAMLMVIVMMMISNKGCDTHASNSHKSLEDKAFHHYEELIKALGDLKMADVARLSKMLDTLANQVNVNNDDGAIGALHSNVSSLVLISLLHSCHSFQNSGEGSETNINIFNNATVNMSYNTKKSSKSGKSTDSNSNSNSKSDSKRSNSTPDEDYKVYEGELSMSWMDDLVRPLDVAMTLDEKKVVTVVFDVLRREPAVASHTWTYKGSEKSLLGPKDYGLSKRTPVSLMVNFTYDSSGCTQSYPPDKKEVFSFERSDTSNNLVIDSVRVSLLACSFQAIEQTLKRSREAEENFNTNWKPEKLLLKVEYPEYWKDLNVHPFKTRPGKNSTRRFVIHMTPHEHYSIEGLLYDSNSDEMIHTNTHILYSHPESADHQTYTEPPQRVMLGLTVVEQERVNGTMPGVPRSDVVEFDSDPPTYLKITFEITLIPKEGESLSGYVYLRHSIKMSPPRELAKAMREVGESMEKFGDLVVMKAIPIVRRDDDEEMTLPIGKIVPHTKTKFLCGDDETSYSRQFSFDKCIFFCSAAGLGLKKIRVRKLGANNGGDELIEDKHSHASGTYSLAMVSLGKARKQIDGEYECRVNGEDGSKHKWKIQVRTWGFPKVTEHTLSLDEASGNYIFKCSGTSERSSGLKQNMTVYTQSQSIENSKWNRIDEDPSLRRKMSIHGNETSLTLTIPPGYLKWPVENLICQNENEAGTAQEYEYLNYNGTMKNYYTGTDHPFLLKGKSGITSAATGGHVAKCVATGKQPLEINFYFDNTYSDDNLIKNDSMHIIKSSRVGDETIATLTSGEIGYPKYSLICKAKNSVGENEIEFYLNQVLGDSYVSPIDKWHLTVL